MSSTMNVVNYSIVEYYTRCLSATCSRPYIIYGIYGTTACIIDRFFAVEIERCRPIAEPLLQLQTVKYRPGHFKVHMHAVTVQCTCGT